MCRGAVGRASVDILKTAGYKVSGNAHVFVLAVVLTLSNLAGFCIGN